MAEQALSLVCTECNAQLRSVKEAQDHGEATGHSSFEESTAAVKRLVCAECRKPCRNEVEQALHTKHTGHTVFEDQTAAKAISTEAEMAEARGDKESASDESQELVEPEVDGEALQELEAMGFCRNRGIRALHHSGNIGVESAVTWLADHEADADLDSPLLVVLKPKLSPEEAQALAAELLAKAREKREAEEKELDRLREQERIRSGKELLAAARQEEDLRLKRAAEARRLEKEEEKRAREKIRVKLEEDRRERRRRLGLPPDPTPEEIEADRARAAARAEEEAARRLPPKLVIPDADRLRDLLVGMKKECTDGARVKLCFQTLFRLCANVAGDPGNPKFRRFNPSNPALAARLLPGSIAFLEAVGWRPGEDGTHLLPPGGEDEAARLATAGAQLDSALNNPFFGAL